MQRHPLGQVHADQLQLAVERAVGVEDRDLHREAVARRDRDRLAQLRLELVLRLRGDVGVDGVLFGPDLDAVDVVAAALAALVLDAQDVLAVGRGGELEDRVVALAVEAAGGREAELVRPRVGRPLRGGVRLAADRLDPDDRVERRAEGVGQRVELELLALLRPEAEAIDVAGLADDAVERDRQVGGRRRRDRVGRVVRLGFEDVGERRHAQPVRRGGGHAVFGSTATNGEVSRRRRAGGRVWSQTPRGSPRIWTFSSVAGLAAGRVDRRGPGERADVQAVRLAGAVVHAVPHLDEVGAVALGEDRQHRVLHVQRRVVGGGELLAVGVVDRQVQVGDAAIDAQAGGLDLGRDALAALHFDPVQIDVGRVVQAAVDRGVAGTAFAVSRLSFRCFCGMLVLLHGRERADEEALVLGQAVAGAESQPVRAERAVVGQLQPDADAGARLDRLLAAVGPDRGFDRLDRFDGDARLVEQDLARLIEEAAGEVHLDGRAALPAGRRRAAPAAACRRKRLNRRGTETQRRDRRKQAQRRNRSIWSRSASSDVPLCRNASMV